MREAVGIAKAQTKLLQKMKLNEEQVREFKQLLHLASQQKGRLAARTKAAQVRLIDELVDSTVATEFKVKLNKDLQVRVEMAEEATLFALEFFGIPTDQISEMRRIKQQTLSAVTTRLRRAGLMEGQIHEFFSLNDDLVRAINKSIIANVEHLRNGDVKAVVREMYTEFKEVGVETIINGLTHEGLEFLGIADLDLDLNIVRDQERGTRLLRKLGLSSERLVLKAIGGAMLIVFIAVFIIWGINIFHMGDGHSYISIGVAPLIAYKTARDQLAAKREHIAQYEGNLGKLVRGVAEDKDVRKIL